MFTATRRLLVSALLALVSGPGFAQQAPARDQPDAPAPSAAQLEKLTGLDVEILSALERRLGIRVRIVPAAWASIERGLLDKRYDAIMNAWVVNSRTPPGITASAPYYEWGLSVVARAGDAKLKSLADLAGRSVGHFSDPTVERSVLSLGAARLVPFDDSDALFEALLEGRIDAAVEDSTYVRWRVAHDPRVKSVGVPLNRHAYVLGVRREDAALLSKLNAAIRELQASGEIQRIRRHWESAKSPNDLPTLR